MIVDERGNRLSLGRDPRYVMVRMYESRLLKLAVEKAALTFMGPVLVDQFGAPLYGSVKGTDKVTIRRY